MRDGVLAHFNADVAAAHLVRYGGGGAGAEEGVEDEVAGVGEKLEDALDESFWLFAFLKLHATFVMKII